MRPPREKKAQTYFLDPRPRVIGCHYRIGCLTPPLGARTLELFGCQRDSFPPENSGLRHRSPRKQAAAEPRKMRLNLRLFKYKARNLL